MAATADSLREREFTQQRQLNSADAKIRKLTALNPKFQNLLRERETLEARLTSYNAKEQEALINADQAADKAENVTVISKAEYANKGRNMRKLAWFGATAAWGFLLFFIAMIRVFLDPRLYSVPAAARMVPMDHGMVDLEPEYVAMPEQTSIPEPIPEYAAAQPLTPNPYDVQPAAYAAPEPLAGYNAQGGGYDPNAYVHYSSTGEVYGSQAAQNEMTASAGYTQDNPYAATQGTNPYQAGFAQVDPNMANPGFSGNAALDLNQNQNPYASGQIQAGSLDQSNGYIPDPNAPPQS